MNKFREEIKRGAALLDNKFPGWESKVNVKTLDMSKASLCLIRQVNPYYEVWHTEREILPLQEGTAESLLHASAEHGFYVEDQGRFPEQAYAPLTQEWIQLLQERQNV